MSSQSSKPRRTSTVAHDPLATPQVYYGESHSRKHARARTYSANVDRSARNGSLSEGVSQGRRISHDEQSLQPRRFLVQVDETLKTLLSREDSDGNYQITIDDKGPKVLSLGTLASNAHNKFDVRGTYMLSNLLQELTLAKDYGRKTIVLDEARLNENPVNRLSRLIQFSFWDGLTRRIDGSNIRKLVSIPRIGPTTHALASTSPKVLPSSTNTTPALPGSTQTCAWTFNGCKSLSMMSCTSAT